MSNHSVTARGTDLPFSRKSVMSTAHEQNIICSKTLMLLFAGHEVGSRPMKRKDKIHQMIIIMIIIRPIWRPFTAYIFDIVVVVN